MAFVEFELSPEARRDLTELQRLFNPQTAFNAIARFFDKRASIVAGEISRNYLSGQRLNRRTGTLARSIVGQTITFRGLPAMRVGVIRGPALAYAAAQEFGAVITPRRAKALAIPTDEAKTAAGVERYGGPRNFPGELRFVPFRNSGVAVGGLFEAESLRASLNLRDARLLYILVREVRIEPQFFLRDGFAMALPGIAEDLAVLLRDLLLGKKVTV